MHRSNVRIAVLLLALACGHPDPPPEAPLEPQALPAATEVDIAAGGRHRYTVHLDAGELLDVAVDQSDVDLTLTVLDNEEREVLRVDGPYAERGTERALISDDAPASFTIEIRASASGHYAVRSLRRQAMPDDAPLLAVTRALGEGDVARRGGDPASARVAYRRAVELARQAGDAAFESLALHRLGQSLRRSSPTEALAAYLDAASVAHAAGLPFAAADLTFGAGGLYLAVGDPKAAEAAFAEAAALYAGLGDRRRQARAENELARAHERQGRLGAARRTYEHVLELAATDDTVFRTSILNNLGELHLRLGANDLALDRINEALVLRRRTGNRRDIGISLISRGTVERRLGQLVKARESFIEAWQTLLGSGAPVYMANALVGLGLTQLELGETDRAERALISARAIYRAAGERRSEAIVILDLAEVALARDQGDSAVDLANAALAVFDALADRQGQASAHFALARAERLRGRLVVAERLNALAIEIMESVRAAAEVEPLRMSFHAFRREYYEHAVDLAVELYRRGDPDRHWLDQALAVSERGRARTFLETLAGVRNDTVAVDPALAEGEALAADRLIELERERMYLAFAPVDAEARDLNARRLRRAALELAEAREALYRASADAGLEPLPFFDVDRFRAADLDAETALLGFSLGDERGHLFWVTADSFDVFSIPSREELDRLSRLAHEALEQSDKPRAGERSAELLRRLSRRLLGPVADRLGNRRLVVVAEGALAYVPFAVLPDPRHLDDEDPPPLVERHEVVSLPSALVLELLRRPRRTSAPRKTLAVLADPIYGPDDPRLGHQEAPADTRRGDVLPLSRLPFTADEAAALLDLVPPGEGFAALGADVTVDLLESGRLSDYRILHIAGHGRLDAEYPDLSGLELSRYDAAGHPRRGTLYAHEVYDLPLGADLVVLSACRTALGREVRGEGLVGLTRGFFHAGASRVVVSLWGVDDRATTELMTLFYRSLLGDGLPPAAALRAAQRELRRDRRWAAPYFWAGFILQGDWR